MSIGERVTGQRSRRPTRSVGARVASRAAAAVLAAGVLAACGGGGAGGGGAGGGGGLYGGGMGSGGGDGGNAAKQSRATSVLATRTVDGVGKVLVDGKGMTLYTSEQEADGTVRCVEDCLGFWFPVTVEDGGEPTVKGAAAGRIGTVERTDDGTTQVTYKGAPLYTFKLDSKPGTAKGDDLSDSFGGTRFTWHAAVLDPAAGGASKQQESGSGYGGYGGGGTDY